MALPKSGPARVEWYLGPDLEIKPEALSKYEASGDYIFEPKFDGMWAMLEVRDPAHGVPHGLKSRDAATAEIDDGKAGDLRTTALPLPSGTILCGELEAATQWATKQVAARGYRRFYVFDIARIGMKDCRALPWTARRKLLEQAHAQIARVPALADRFQLVPYVMTGFRARYEEWLALGLEGGVLKHKDSPHLTSRGDGKTEKWFRCKKHVTEDYVLVGLGKTPGGTPTGRWGLHVNGKLTFILQANCPQGLLKEEYVGKVVCEFMGWERFDSGSLRHAQFVRVRTDKPSEQCILRAASFAPVSLPSSPVARPRHLTLVK